MTTIPTHFRHLATQFLHIVILPVFFFIFMLTYQSFGISDMLSYEWLGVHLTIISCIVFISLCVTRAIFYFLPVKMNYTLYILWCTLETVFSSFFVALYMYLVLGKPMPYFDMLASAHQYLFFTLIYPYVILALSLSVYDYRNKLNNPELNSPLRMRFYDTQRNLKLVLMPHTVLYIAAEENYVTINYKEGEKKKEYVLRSSMKALDELCNENGIVRCHRSYYINPTHVKLLRKDKDGIMYAELNSDDFCQIPVSKTYYKSLSELL